METTMPTQEQYEKFYTDLVNCYSFRECGLKEKKRIERIAPRMEECMRAVMRGEEIILRVNDEIWRGGDGHYSVPNCTAKEYRGVRIFLRFDDMKLKVYPNDKQYFYVLDEKGEVMKTKGKYAAVVGEIDNEDTYFRADWVHIRVKSIRLI